MFSRAGKSTNNLYLAFQDKERLNTVQSKVATYLGKTQDLDKSKEPVSQIDQIRNLMAQDDVVGTTSGAQANKRTETAPASNASQAAAAEKKEYDYAKVK